MCIMEIRAGQHSSTMIQACAHNLDTVLGDLEMFKGLIVARNRQDILNEVNRANDQIQHAYAGLLGLFTREVASMHNPDDPRHRESEHLSHHDNPHSHDERTLVEEAHHFAQQGRKYMTR